MAIPRAYRVSATFTQSPLPRRLVTQLLVARSLVLWGLAALMGVGAALTGTVALGAVPPGSADSAVAAPVTLTPDQTLIPLRQPGTTAAGVLTVRSGGVVWSQLELRLQPLALGNNWAYVRLPQLDGAPRANLGDPRLACREGKPCPVTFEVTGVTARGTYTGAAEVYSEGVKIASTNLSVVLPDTGFAPVLASEFLKNDVLNFDATQTSAFFITLSSPAGYPARTVKLSAALPPPAPRPWPWTLSKACGSGTAGLGFDPESLVLDGGTAKPVLVSAPACLPPGTYPATLHVTAAGDPSLDFAKAVIVTKYTPATLRRVLLLLWVVVGAILSVALNNAFPLSRARSDRFEELRTIDAKIGGCSAIGPPLRGTLRSESRRLWLLIDGVNFLNSRKEAILAEAELSMKNLSAWVELAALVSSLRVECGGAPLPIRILLTIEQHLQFAEEALLRADPPAAQARMAAATQLARADCSAKDLAAQLAADIAKLLIERPNGGDPVPPAGRDPVARAASRDKAVRAGRPHPIAQRVAQLEVDRLLLGNMNIPELLAIERDFYIADMWTDVVEFAMKIAPDHFDPIIDPLRSQLEAAPASAPTQALIALLRSNLAPEDIDTALRAGEARIVADPFVRYLDLIDFDFEFTNPALNAVRAAAQFPDYQWEFDDRTTAPDEGSRCKHFFWLPGRRQRAWWWLTRQSLRTHLVKIHVTVPFTSSPTYTFKQVLTMRRPKARASSVGAMQIITFIVTTGMAILAAFGAEYGSALPTSVDWGAAVTALLFGFGIDQIRDRAATR